MWEPNQSDVESGVKHHVFRHEEPGVVDHPFDEGGSEDLVVGKVSDVSLGIPLKRIKTRRT